MGRPGVRLGAGAAPAQDARQLPIALLVWAGVALLLALAILIAHLRARTRYRASLPVEHPFVKAWTEAHRLRRPVQVRYSDQIDAPLTYGLLWPVVLLPKSLDWADEDRLASSWPTSTPTSAASTRCGSGCWPPRCASTGSTPWCG